MRHSQSLSALPLKPWVGIKQSDCVRAAHCTCMAGLGEACSHVVGLLFASEENSKMKKQTSCTSLPCSWLPPSFQNVSYEPLAKINFSVSKLGDTTTKTEGSSSSAASKSVKVKDPSELEKSKFFYSPFKTKK